ncbi:MAG TPA: hypothetical protein VFJ91_01605 [Gaiellaceae bacterium]|nr:hypothetical protein [Gaiellaceae bacterium]
MPGFLLANGLRPFLFALAIAAGVVAGERSDSFWVGLLAFLVGSATGRAIRRLIRGRPGDAVYEALWPGAAVGFAYLFASGLGWAKWLSVILAFVCAGVAKRAVANSLFPRRRGRVLWYRLDEWGLPGPDDVVPGRWTRRDG